MIKKKIRIMVGIVVIIEGPRAATGPGRPPARRRRAGPPSEGSRPEVARIITIIMIIMVVMIRKKH